MSHQGRRQDPADVKLIKAYPDIFANFYAVPTTWLDRSYFKEVRDFVTYLATWFRWLPVALLQDSGDFLEVFDRWRRWLTERNGENSGEDMGLVPYYSHRKFRTEFLEFVGTCYLEEMATARAAIATLVETEGLSLASLNQSPAETSEQIDHF